MDGVSTHIARDDLLEMKWVSHTVFDLLPLDRGADSRLLSHSARGNTYLTFGLSFVNCEA
jgi:hypothetical protein